MPLVAKKRSRIPGSFKLIAVVALHMNWPAAQETCVDKSSHAPCRMPKLIIMPGGYLKSSFARECNQSSGFVLVERERLLDIDVTSKFQAELRNGEMAVWGRSDVDDVWSGTSEEFGQVVVVV